MEISKYVNTPVTDTEKSSINYPYEMEQCISCETSLCIIKRSVTILYNIQIWHHQGIYQNLFIKHQPACRKQKDKSNPEMQYTVNVVQRRQRQALGKYDTVLVFSKVHRVASTVQMYEPDISRNQPLCRPLPNFICDFSPQLRDKNLVVAWGMRLS